MLNKAEFLLRYFLLLIGILMVSIGIFVIVSVLSARAEESLKYKVYLPFVAKNANLTPKIEIIYLPSYGAPINEMYPVRGRVLNSDPSASKLLIYTYTPIYVPGDGLKEGWGSISTSCGNDAPLDSNGYFTITVGTSFSPLYNQYQRYYLTAGNYCPPQIYYNAGGAQIPVRIELPPDPPTSEVWAMVEIERIYPEGWRIIQRKP